MQGYVSKADHDVDSIRKFYEELGKVLKQCNSQGIIYVAENFNAEASKKRIRDTVRPCGLENKNDKRNNLVAWCYRKHAVSESRM